MLDDSQISHFRGTQYLSLADMCHILQYSVARNDYKEEVVTYTDTNGDIPCGLQQTGGQEAVGDKETVVSYDAILRLPHGIPVDMRNRVMITKRFGAAITPIIYDFVSPAYEGPSGIRVLLKKSSL